MAIYGRWIINVSESMRRGFLNGHIWSLDSQCDGKHVTKFSELPLSVKA